MENKKKLTLISVIAVVAIALLVGALLYQHSQMNEMVEAMAWEKEQLEEEYQDLAVQFDGYQGIEIRNDSLQSLLTKEQQRVQDLMEELRITKATNARRIAELKRELATVREVLASYVVQIDSLNRTNERLTAENKQYRQQYTAVSEEAKVLKQEQRELKKVVTRASMLEVTSFAFTPLNKHDRKTRYKSHMCKFQFAYTIGKNVTCPVGLKNVYIRVVTPEGDLIGESEDKQFSFEKSMIGYSCVNEIEYGGEPVSDTQYLPIAAEPEKGLYNADFFVDGQMIASFPFEIK